MSLQGNAARRGLTTLVCALAAALGTTTATATATPYVALGDSFAAAPLVPPQSAVALNCLRSGRNYPSWVASTLSLQLDDNSCSGATTDDFTTWQGVNPPQLNGLDGTTKLVTVTIGANDAGLGGAALRCIRPLPLLPCKDIYIRNGDDTLHDNIVQTVPKIGAALDAIHARAPFAKVVVTGYGNYIRPGGCYPYQAVLPQDGDYLAARMHELDLAIRDQARARGLTFVDLETPGTGHDACASPSQRWIEGVIPAQAAAPMHPNATGTEAMGAIIARAAAATR
jgi:lysophospholipase L1-like esterase